MTQKEEKEIDLILEATKNAGKLEGIIESLKRENEYLRRLVEEKFRQSVVSSQVCRLYVPEANTTAGNCANCGKPSWQH